MTTSSPIKLSVRLLVGFALIAWFARVSVPRAAGCDAVGNVRFICDQAGPEDLFPVPGGRMGMHDQHGARIRGMRRSSSRQNTDRKRREGKGSARGSYCSSCKRGMAALLLAGSEQEPSSTRVRGCRSGLHLENDGTEARACGHRRPAQPEWRVPMLENATSSSSDETARRVRSRDDKTYPTPASSISTARTCSSDNALPLDETKATPPRVRSRSRTVVSFSLLIAGHRKKMGGNRPGCFFG